MLIVTAGNLCTLWFLVSQVNCHIISSSIQTSNSIKATSQGISAPLLTKSANSVTAFEANNTEDPTPNQVDLEQYWLNQRDLFISSTTFNLTKVSCSGMSSLQPGGNSP